jgi:predicted Rossmann fold flavoprotein
MNYDVIVVGAGACGIMSAITSARENRKVLLLEKLPKIAAKLKATGGGRCNLTNSLKTDEFMQKFGKNGRFMQECLNEFDANNLREFLKEIGVETHIPDGFRVFPTSHSSSTIINAFEEEMKKLNIDILTSSKVEEILLENESIKGLKTSNNTFYTKNIILATGGKGYPMLGSEGDGFELAKKLGHKITELFPAMMPLHTKERWVENCRADTLPKVEIKVNIKKYQKLKAQGDLIFTKEGIRGPVVLDFAREITPLLDKYDEVPILISLKNLNQEEISKHLKNEYLKNPKNSILEHLKTLLPESISNEICKMIEINPESSYKNIEGFKKVKLIEYLEWLPLTINGSDGFDKAMITRGGINLKEINPKTMQSKLIKGLYFCGEVVNIDGPCGGYNLQWSVSSGYVAGKLR